MDIEKSIVHTNQRPPTEPPEPPKNRLIAEGDFIYCPVCGSGMYWSWRKFKRLCRQHCGERYHGRNG